MIRLSAILIGSLTLAGCSLLVELAIFNRSGADIKVCNLNHEDRPCQIVPDGEIRMVNLIAAEAADSWRYSVDGLPYSFSFGTYPEHASNIYCKGIFSRRCAIPVQFESNRHLYWVGKDQELPVKTFPSQPKGFPVGPGA